ncbi:MAG: DNA repair exonuclease [Acidobacteria bacterium]|nr:DNA repair exonuclease [Acidobacteriota bacterium]
MSRPILLVGDLHLGRRPAGLDGVLRELGLAPRELSAVVAWEATVQWAIRREVRAVILAGDVVEGMRDRFEAFTHLARGAQRLAGAGISLLAVAGNHDVEVLPRLAERLAKVRLVGAGGRWEIVPVPGRDDEPPVDLLGWSFPAATVRDDPTKDPSFEEALSRRREGARLIGVVHGDLDAPGSRYAPLSRHRLEQAPVDAWFLGHIHAPGTLEGPRRLGYLGSVGALDPGETGVHGPWELELDTGLTLRQIPLSPVRFENVELELADDAPVNADTLLDTLARRIREQLAPSVEVTAGAPRLLAVRLTLTGRPHGRRAVDEIVRLEPVERLFPGDDPPLVITRVTDRTRPAIDLEELAAAPTPAGELARILRALENGPPVELLEEAKRAIAPWKDSGWTGEAIPPPPETVELLRAAARRALQAVLDSRGEEESS